MRPQPFKGSRKIVDDNEPGGVVIENDFIFDSKFSDLVRFISADNLNHGPLLLCATLFRPTALSKYAHLFGETYHYIVDDNENF